MKISSVFTLVVCAVAAQASFPTLVLSDLAAINTQVTSLNTLLQAYPTTGGSLAGALAIHNAAAALVNPINTATLDTNALTPLPISVTDGTSFENAVDVFKPTIVAALNRIVAVKPSITALTVGGLAALVHTDLVNLNTATNALEAALIAKAPTAALVTRAQAIKATIDAGFTTALAAYP